MKAALHVVVYAIFLTAPLVAFAQQSDAGVTRAQVRDELIALEQAGYAPNYPASLQAAQQRLARNPTAAQTQGGDYGPSSSGSSQAGRAETSYPAQSVYFGM